MLKKPVWITNFKNYDEATGQHAVDLAKIHEKVAKETGASIAVAVGALDVWRVAKEVSIPVLCQHCDAIDFGKFTGHILPQGIRRSGGIGTLINHSERRLEFDVLHSTVACAQKSSLARIVCAEDPDEIEKFAELSPDFLAFEPPELIGSTTNSVARAKPDSITESVTRSRRIPVLVGAGVSTVEDVEVSMQLGAQGFLAATVIVKAKDSEKILTDLVTAMMKSAN